MSALAAWRERYAVEPQVLAIGAAISVDLLERIEAGEVEPSFDVALRIHAYTGGGVPVASWPALADHPCVVGSSLQAVGANSPQGWGVAIMLGGSPIAQLSVDRAGELAAMLLEAAGLAARPPRALP